MKNTKLYLISVVLLLVFFAGGSWAYKTFFKSEDAYTGEIIYLKPIDSLQNSAPVTEPVKKNGSAITKKQPIKETPKNQQDNMITPVKKEFYPVPPTKTDNETAKEINRLKAEIEALRNKQTKDSELQLAKQKIDELQQKVDKLVDKSSHVETENKKLFAMLRHFSDERAGAEQKIKPWPAVFENKVPEEKVVKKVASTNVTPVNTSNNKLPVANTAKTDKVAPSNTTSARSSANLFAADDMRLSAMTVTDNNKDIETYQAFQTDKLVGFINLKNTASQNNSGELIIVILQPDGNVLQQSAWESGTFQTNEGKKIYSCKLRFNYQKGENNQLSFSLNAPSFTKGNYIMQVYCGGVMIGKMVKKLS